jgi:predicted Zn-dependent protease
MASSALDNLFAEFDEGMRHLAARRWDEAIAALRAAVRREPGRLAVVRALATAHLQSGDGAAARRALADFTISYPMCAEGWRLAAQLEWKLNQYNAATAILSRGLEHLPNSQALHRQIALFWGARGKLARQNGEWESGRIGESEQGRIGEGEAGDSDWLDRVAQDSMLLASLIDLPERSADLEMLRAVEARLSRLLETQPDHPDLQLALARLRVKLGALPEAMLAVQRALTANPQYPQAQRLRAAILAKLGEYDAAIEILEGLIAQGAKWADIHYQLAELQRQRGRDEAARSHLYSAICLNPSFKEARQLLERWAA